MKSTLTIKQLCIYLRDELRLAFDQQNDAQIHALLHTLDIINDAAGAVNDGPVARLTMDLLANMNDHHAGVTWKSVWPTDEELAALFDERR